jgi:hypothetical protein
MIQNARVEWVEWIPVSALEPDKHHQLMGDNRELIRNCGSGREPVSLGGNSNTNNKDRMKTSLW